MSQVYCISRRRVPMRAVPSCNSPAPRMCPAGVRNDGLATRCKENGHTCAEHMPWNGLQSRSGTQVNFRNQRWTANPSPSAAFRSQAESAYRQYRVVRWLLLPETELCLRPAATLDCKFSVTVVLTAPVCKSAALPPAAISFPRKREKPARG